MDIENVNLSNSYFKKLERKKRKCQYILEKETGITYSDSPTKNLAICNAGLVNGLSLEILAEHYLKYGCIERIVMIPGKSYCFILYQQKESAVNAFKYTNGILNIAQYNKPLILCYCNDIPDIYLKNSHITETPSGLTVIEDFITEQEESLLLSLNNFSEISNNGLMKHRQVKHYGYEFKYDINNVDKNCPLEENIPEECDFLWTRLASKQTDISFKPDQLTVNCYKPGQGIPSHVDTHSAFEDVIISLSLGSSVIMEFKHEDGRHSPILLPRRSLTIISKESRYAWTHGITPRKLDVISINNQLTVIKRDTRVSFTFRKIRNSECCCKFVHLCDSYLSKQKSDVLSSVASKLENTHVHEVYEYIASHFSATRHKPWPAVLNFVETLEIGSILADVGCGNGKYLGHNKNIIELGCDRSFSLIDVCNSRGFEVFSCNCLNVPLRSNSVDAALSIAVIHHLATEERRLQAIQELIRILRPNGKALIYVWAKNQNKDQRKTNYLKYNKNQDESVTRENLAISVDISLPIHKNRTQFKHVDVLVPWKLKEKNTTETEDVFFRYYHVFDEGELEKLCEKIRNIDIIKSYYDEGNWCVIIKKIK